jgi:hypothetical protein
MIDSFQLSYDGLSAPSAPIDAVQKCVFAVAMPVNRCDDAVYV